MRNVREAPNTFREFPADETCPMCGTNDDGPTVLIAIDGTERDGIAEAKCFHLACAVAKHYRQDMCVIYRETEE